jgi:hypothetical protein
MKTKKELEVYKVWRKQIEELSDGRYSSQISSIVGCPQTYVIKVWNKPENRHLPRPRFCAPRGETNHAWTCGRIFQRDGRVLVPAPEDHPHRRVYSYKKIGRILEHRLVMEKHLGRYLSPNEVVDHIDECALHNDIKNLRLFSKNSIHLKETISGRKKDVSFEGRLTLRHPRNHLKKDLPRIDRWKDMYRCGDARLLQILHGWLLLDKDSPYLLGTHRYLEQNKIDYFCDRKIKASVISLCQKWGLDQKLSRLKHLL